jgi:hypothetical protein
MEKICRYVVSTRVLLFSDVFVTEIWLMKRKLNALKVVAKRMLVSITCKSSGGQQIGHPALRRLILSLETLLHKIMCDNGYIN